MEEPYGPPSEYQIDSTKPWDPCASTVSRIEAERDAAIRERDEALDALERVYIMRPGHYTLSTDKAAEVLRKHGRLPKEGS